MRSQILFLLIFSEKLFARYDPKESWHLVYFRAKQLSFAQTFFIPFYKITLAKYETQVQNGLIKSNF